MEHWKVGDGLMLPEGGKIIDQIAVFEIKREGQYIVVFYDGNRKPIWLMPMTYDKKMRETMTRDAAIKKYKLYIK